MRANRTIATSLLLASTLAAATCAVASSGSAEVTPQRNEAAPQMREIVHVQLIPGVPIPILIIVPPSSAPPPSK
jgi:hypothetical protein